MKKGFSLIELVLSIVIIGISVSVLPNVIAQTNKLNITALEQSLLYDAKTLSKIILSKPWDSKIVCETKATSDYYVGIYQTDDTTISDLKISRPGILDASNREAVKPWIKASSVGDFNSTSSSCGSYNDKRQDIDDYNGISIEQQAYVSSSLINSKTTVSVKYEKSTNKGIIELQDDSGIRDIKKIEVTSEDRDNPKYKIKLVYYLANVGEPKQIPTAKWK
ncbi:type II secretion system protein [Campylobacter portucalensis]|nr:type II secretion system protein [Campylobacter portucalensis]